jgi:hypothetical protein
MKKSLVVCIEAAGFVVLVALVWFCLLLIEGWGTG